MSAGDKKKLDGIANNANNYTYTHPSSSGWKHIPSGGSSGQILRWASDGTATWGNDNNTTYGTATQSANGLMSASDKKKLDGVANGANYFTYSHPSTHPATMISTDSNNRFVTDGEKNSWNGRIPISNIVNNCTSWDTDKPLAANQGRVLMDKINTKQNILTIQTVNSGNITIAANSAKEIITTFTPFNGYSIFGMLYINVNGATYLSVNSGYVDWNNKRCIAWINNLNSYSVTVNIDWGVMLSRN